MSTPFTPPGGEPTPPSGPVQPPRPEWSGHPSPGYGLAYVDPREQPRRPATTTMAAWSLGTSFIFCVPALSVLSIVLGIIVLVRSRDGRDHGSGMAIAGIAIGSVALVAQLVFISAAIVEAVQEDQREAVGPVTARQQADERDQDAAPVETVVSKLHIGDCFDDPAFAGSTGPEPVKAGPVTQLPCSEPHQLEVFEIRNMLGDEWPGQAAIDKETEACFPAFKEFNQVPYARSDLEVIYYYPTKESWSVLGDHSVTCTVTDPAGPTPGTLKAARR